MSRFAYPRFRQDVAFLETPDGVYVKAPDGPFILRGPQMYKLVSALVPHLDGVTPTATLLAGLGPHQAEMVASLLDSLGDRAVVREAGVPRAGLEPFDRQRMLLSDLGDDGSGFDAVVSARVLVVGGDAEECAVVVRTLQENGVGACHGDGVQALAPEQVTDAVLDPADVVVMVAVSKPHPTLLELSRRVSGHCRVLPVLRLGEEIVLGPWQLTVGSPSVESLLLRAADNGIPGALAWWQVSAAGSSAAQPGPLLPAAATEIALGSAAFEVFRSLGGITGHGLDGALVRLDTTTLELVRESAPLHPAAGRGQSGTVTAVPPQPWDRLRSTAEVAADQYYEALSGICGDVAGIVRRFTDDPAPQLPVKVAVLDAPVLGAEPVVAYSIAAVLDARCAAFEEALAEYAVQMARRLLMEEQALCGVADVWAFSSSMMEHPSHGLGAVTTVRDLASDELVTVPTDAVLAGPWARECTTYEPVATDVVARRTPADALRGALAAALGAEAVRAAESGARPLLEIHEEDIGAREPGSPAGFLLTAARSQGRQPRLFTVDAPVAVAVLIDGADPGQRGLAVTGATLADAVVDVLTRAVGITQVEPTPWRQAGTARQPWVTTADARWVAADPASLRHEYEATLDELLAHVRGEGRRAFAADLTPPDLRGVTAVCRVLLSAAPA